MEDIKYWIWLSRLENISPKTLGILLKKLENPKELWNKTKEDLNNLEVQEKHIEEITNPKYRSNLDRYLEYMQKNNIKIITIYDKDYPEKLKEIYDPPILLYVKGNNEILKEKAIAMVGCRLCSKYGENIAQRLAYNLSLNNINIISGLAKGIDTASHIGTLKAQGKTIAVVRVWIRYSLSRRK